MTPLEALLELLERVGMSQGGAVLVCEEELSHWPAEAVLALQSNKLLVRGESSGLGGMSGLRAGMHDARAYAAQREGATASFVVCDKRDDINRVAVSAERLRQWRCGAEAVSAFVAQSLGMRSESQRRTDAGLWELGLVTGKKRSQMVCLRANEALELVAGDNAVPLAELVSCKAGCCSVDDSEVRRLVDAATTGDSRYTPSNVRRDARKLETQDIHAAWQKEYRTLKKRRPEMSDVWYSQQIAKMDIANRRSAETIRKHMKR